MANFTDAVVKKEMPGKPVKWQVQDIILKSSISQFH